MKIFIFIVSMFITTSAYSAEQSKLDSAIRPVKDIKILYTEVHTSFDENSFLRNQLDWLGYGDINKKTTAKTMIQEGWTLQNMVALNAKQFYLVFVK